MPITTAEFDYIRDFVRQRSAIVLDPGKEYLVESRLTPLAKSLGIESIGKMVDELKRGSNRSLQNQIVEAMTTNETSFFRDVQPFEALKSTVIPNIMKARDRERSLSIWSAACSSGQEPYTIAMTLRETFPQLASWNLKILATDLSTEMVSKAREGRYAQIEANRGLPAPLLGKYFDRAGMGWQVKDDIKRGIEFREMNLVTPWQPMPRFDVVFIRNVLIYFDVETKRLVLNRVSQVLKPDGYLFLGAAETTVNIHDGFERVQLERAGCYKVRG